MIHTDCVEDLLPLSGKTQQLFLYHWKYLCDEKAVRNVQWNRLIIVNLANE
jgi:hypothetical protein